MRLEPHFKSELYSHIPERGQIAIHEYNSDLKTYQMTAEKEVIEFLLSKARDYA